MYRLKELQVRIAEVFEAIDVMVVPTAGTIYRISEVETDPITLNANLGYYTNFLNFLDFGRSRGSERVPARGLYHGDHDHRTGVQRRVSGRACGSIPRPS